VKKAASDPSRTRFAASIAGARKTHMNARPPTSSSSTKHKHASASIRAPTVKYSANMRVCPRCCSIYVSQVSHCGLDGEQLVNQDQDPLIGRRIDRYEFTEVIGHGAMGVVYRARHVALNSDFAVKVLYGEFGSNADLAERFRREAQAACRIRHANIISIADFGTSENGLNYLVMETAEGQTLEKVIENEAPLSPLRAAHITRQIAAGLGEAHRLGFVHRDVKPSNIIVQGNEPKELIKILDFGVVTQVADTSARLTAEGRLIGTPRYMAPEQAREPSVGPTADLYSVGVMLHEMLTGHVPFPGEVVADVLVAHSTQPPPSIGPAEGLERITLWLLEKDPSARPASADEVIAELGWLFPESSTGETRVPYELFQNDRTTSSSSGHRPPSSGSELSVHDTHEAAADLDIPRTDRSRGPSSAPGFVTSPDHAIADFDGSRPSAKDTQETLYDSAPEPIPLPESGGGQPSTPTPSEDAQRPTSIFSTFHDVAESVHALAGGGTGRRWSKPLWKPLTVAAVLVGLVGVGLGLRLLGPSTPEEVARSDANEAVILPQENVAIAPVDPTPPEPADAAPSESARIAADRRTMETQSEQDLRRRLTLTLKRRGLSLSDLEGAGAQQTVRQWQQLKNSREKTSAKHDALVELVLAAEHITIGEDLLEKKLARTGQRLKALQKRGAVRRIAPYAKRYRKLRLKLRARDIPEEEREALAVAIHSLHADIPAR
jgi:eukaryotic-like serine/threonine-protein kinase